MASFTALVDEVVQSHLDLAWGWWTELGVPGSMPFSVDVGPFTLRH